MEIGQHSVYTCVFCGKVRCAAVPFGGARLSGPSLGLRGIGRSLIGAPHAQDTMKRTCVGIWNCKACGKTTAGACAT
jgi:ribosomal protein L37AE/L43A